MKKPLGLVIKLLHFSFQNQLLTLLTLLPLDKMAAISRMIFSGAFLLMKRFFDSNITEACLSLGVQLKTTQVWLSGVPDLRDRTNILRCGDLSHLHVPDCIWVFFNFVWFFFIHRKIHFYFELCTYCNILDIYLLWNTNSVKYLLFYMKLLNHSFCNIIYCGLFFQLFTLCYLRHLSAWSLVSFAGCRACLIYMCLTVYEFSFICPAEPHCIWVFLSFLFHFHFMSFYWLFILT